jgi:DNA-binding NtrC family response regulator
MSSKRALIVEDNVDDQRRLKRLLESRKIEADVVDSPLEARLKLKERKYLFIILDLDLGAGLDEGKFLLDTMLQENLQRPTIIMSYVGLHPDTVALKGTYKFIHTFIDKKHLQRLLSVFDDAINEILQSDKRRGGRASGGGEAQSPELWGTMLAVLVALVVVLGSVATVAQLVSPIIFGVVLISAILLFLLVGVLVLKLTGKLTEAGFLEVAGKIVKALPGLRRNEGGGKGQEEG